eukprot:Gb_13645 [translate_table: standard]
MEWFSCISDVDFRLEVADTKQMGSASDEQNDGWPLGLQPLHVRVRLMENHILTEPNAFNALIAVSPSFSSDSSSDLDTESTGSFFYDKSITLGNLIGLQSDIGVSTRVIDGREHPSAEVPRRNKRNSRSKTWWGLCGSSDDCRENNMPPSLGQFLEVERRAAASSRREKMYFNIMYDEFTSGQTTLDTNPLFADGRILPPQSTDRFASDGSDLSDTNPSWVPPEWFSTHPDSRRNSVRSSHHHRSHSLGSKVPTFFSGICGRTSIEA